MTAPRGFRVALSISDGPAADLRVRGMTKLHLRHAFVEITRQLLAAGASIAYGGDLRRHGFTDILLDLLHTYSRDDRPDIHRVRTYLAWPGLDQLSPGELARLRTIATVVPTPRPSERALTVADEVRDHGRTADSFSLMRQRMTDETDARIVLGGALTGFVGRYPGVVEEALLTARAGHALFVLGGYGGAAAALADLISGGTPTALTSAAMARDTPGYTALTDSWPDIEVDAMAEQLADIGVAGLNNGLTARENRALFTSTTSTRSSPSSCAASPPSTGPPDRHGPPMKAHGVCCGTRRVNSGPSRPRSIASAVRWSKPARRPKAST